MRIRYSRGRKAAGRQWLHGVDTRRWSAIVSAFGSGRPIPGDEPTEIVALKQPFAACGKLPRIFYASSRRFRHQINC
jgi:hypothetical protein